MLEQHCRRPRVTSQRWTTACEKSALGLFKFGAPCARDLAICSVVTVFDEFDPSWVAAASGAKCVVTSHALKKSDTVKLHTQHTTTPHTTQASKTTNCFDVLRKGSQEGHSTKPSCSLFSKSLHTNWHFGVRGKGGNVKFASRAWAKRRQYAG